MGIVRFFAWLAESETGRGKHIFTMKFEAHSGGLWFALWVFSEIGLVFSSNFVSNLPKAKFFCFITNDALGLWERSLIEEKNVLHPVAKEKTLCLQIRKTAETNGRLNSCDTWKPNAALPPTLEETTAKL